MGVVTYTGFVALTVGLGVAVRWIDPAIVEQLARRTGLDRTKGFLVLLVAALWMYLPFLAGAGTGGEGELWLVGPALAAVGFYLGTIAVTSRDEYRLLRRADAVAPDRVNPSPSDDVVAVSDTPTVGNTEQAVSPFTGMPAVHTDWIVQRRTRTGVRTHWRNVASGVQAVEFTLGDGAVTVTPGRHRVFSNVERMPVFEPDDDLPEQAAATLRAEPSLPDPDTRVDKLRFMETIVPSDQPVTVIGVPQQGEQPGEYVIAGAPPDTVLETHTDQLTAPDTPEPILVHGALSEARRLLKKRVVWLGTAAVGLILGGQALAFFLSGATLTTLL